MTRFYILVHLAVPTFLHNNEDVNDPASFSSAKSAHSLAQHHTTCQRVGYTVIGWDAVQYGNGIVETSRGVIQL